MGLYKKQSGLIFDEHFIQPSSLEWIKSPSSAVYMEPDFMHLEHSDYETVALFTLPENNKDVLLEVTASYLPTEDGDEGGIIIWRSSNARLEFLESKYNTAGEYSVWRAKKEGLNWYFYAKKNGSWEFFDNAPLNAGWAGLILKSNGTGFKNMLVDRVVMCEGEYFYTLNLNQNFKLELLDTSMKKVSEHTVSGSDSGLKIALPSVPFTGYIRLYENGQLESETELLTIYGGDIFAYGFDLDIYWKGIKLSEFSPTRLGRLMNGMLTEKMVLKNNTDITAAAIYIVIAPYKTDISYKFAQLAHDIGGVPDSFHDSIFIGTLGPGESKEFWLKVNKDNPNYFNVEESLFSLEIVHD